MTASSVLTYIIRLIIFGSLYSFAFWILFDPLTIQWGEYDWRIIGFVVLLVFLPLGFYWPILRKEKRQILSLAGGVFIICMLVVTTHWGGLFPERRTLDTETVVAFAEGRRVAALECVLRKRDLAPIHYRKRTRDSYVTASGNRISHPVCPGSEVSWEYGVYEDTGFMGSDPAGWRYRALLNPTDYDVSDGTFEFSMISRRGEHIFCTQEKCELR